MPEDDNSLVRRLGMAGAKIDGTYYLCAKKFGVKENVLDLLYALDDGVPHTQKQISDDWLIPKTTINTNVKELVAAGYAELLPSEGAHEKAICLTETGKRYVGDIMRGVHIAETEALAKTVEKFSSEFIDALEYYAERYREEVDKLPRRGRE